MDNKKNKKQRLTSAILIPLLLLSGCSTASESVSAKTLSPKATETPFTMPSPTPLPLQLEGMQEITIRSISISVEQSYPQIEEEFMSPIEETLSQILGSMGIATCEQGELCDASLNIVLAIEAIRAGYTGGEKCYTGAKAEGQMTLDIPNHEPLNISIQGRKDPPLSIMSCPEEPSEAHFFFSWVEALLNGLYEVWSIQLLTAALQDQDTRISYAAMQILEDLEPSAVESALPALVDILNNKCIDHGSNAAYVIRALKSQDEKVVQALIQCLEQHKASPTLFVETLETIGPAAINAVPTLVSLFEEGEDYTNNRILEALQAITGQNFGLDMNQWLEWWEEQQ